MLKSLSWLYWIDPLNVGREVEGLAHILRECAADDNRDDQDEHFLAICDCGELTTHATHYEFTVRVECSHLSWMIFQFLSRYITIDLGRSARMFQYQSVGDGLWPLTQKLGLLHKRTLGFNFKADADMICFMLNKLSFSHLLRR